MSSSQTLNVNAMGQSEPEHATSSTVTVACKLPLGLIIRKEVEVIIQENLRDGSSRAVKEMRSTGPRIYIKGTLRKSTEIIGGYAITDNVDSVVWNQWKQGNHAALRNNLIFGDEKRDRVIGWAKEHASQKSGLEPISATMVRKDERMAIEDPRVATAGASQVVKGEAA